MSRLKKYALEGDTLLEQGVETVCRADKRLAWLVDQVGVCTLKADQIQNPFEALAESIVYQQLTGKAASTIFGRVRALCKRPGPMTAVEMNQVTIETLRAAGCSQAKALAIKDLAAKTISGVVPTIDEMHELSDDELIQRLTEIRGIGKWTVEMMLIFRLGRLNVMPADDYGVRKGFALTYDLAELPTPKALTAYGERWRPYRTIGSWYMWRANELPPETWAKNKNKPVRGTKKSEK